MAVLGNIDGYSAAWGGVDCCAVMGGGASRVKSCRTHLRGPQPAPRSPWTAALRSQKGSAQPPKTLIVLVPNVLWP